MERERPKVLVAVASGKGGVGKSTVSLNLALALAESGLAVGLLDADLYGPDIPRMLGITRYRAAKHVTVWRNPESAGALIEPLERFGIMVMSTQFFISEDQSLAMSMPIIDLLLARLIQQVEWGALDFLIIDLPPGTADVQQHVVTQLPLAGVLLVVTPQDVAHLDAKKVLTMLALANVPVLGGVENMIGMRCPHCDGEVDLFPRVENTRSIWAAGVDRWAAIPFDPLIAQAGEQGKPLLASHPHSPQAEAFRALAARLRQASSP
jgi:ATP-binding protein involved in chromosome partitioning